MIIDTSSGSVSLVGFKTFIIATPTTSNQLLFFVRSSGIQSRSWNLPRRCTKSPSVIVSSSLDSTSSPSSSVSASSSVLPSPSAPSALNYSSSVCSSSIGDGTGAHELTFPGFWVSSYECLRPWSEPRTKGNDCKQGSSLYAILQSNMKPNDFAIASSN